MSSLTDVCEQHNPVSSCLDFAARFLAPAMFPREIEEAKAEIERAKAAGLITVAPPAGITACQRRKIYTSRLSKNRQAQFAAQAAEREANMNAKLDRVVARVRANIEAHGPLPWGALPQIAMREGIDYRRLLNRVKGRTKKSRL